MASTYAPELVNTVLRGLRQQMLDDGWISELELQFAGPSPTEPVFDLKDERADEFDDHTGAQLPGDLVHAGKMKEIRWVREIGLYKNISRAEAVRRGITVVPIRWVVTDKGDPNRPKVRCRLVGKELNSSVRCSRGKSLKCCWDFLSAIMFRTQKGKSLKCLSSTSVELTSWRQRIVKHASSFHRKTNCQKDGDAVRLLLRSMYKFRTASANWMRDWQATLEEGGYKVGVANPALFHRSDDGGRGGVHGDDFAVVGSRRALDRMGKTLSGKYSMRESHRLGCGSHCERHAELLNRIVSVGKDSDGRRYVRIEPDTRHAELVLRDLGLEGSKGQPLTSPGFKVDEKELALREKRFRWILEMLRGTGVVS